MTAISYFLESREHVTRSTEYKLLLAFSSFSSLSIQGNAIFLLEVLVPNGDRNDLIVESIDKLDKDQPLER